MNRGIKIRHGFTALLAGSLWLYIPSGLAAQLPQPSQPILLVEGWNPVVNPFSSYLSEILLSEGIVAHQRVQLSDLLASPAPGSYLQSFQTVILSEVMQSPTAENVFSNYVAQGGNLVAMRPSAGLRLLCGQTRLGARPEAALQFVLLDTNTVAGAGLSPLSLQYHGPADNCALAGGVPLAWFCGSMNTVSTNPAVVWNRYELGQTVCFNFDLARSIVLTRQGNPDWSDSEGDGVSGYRPADVFMRTSGQMWFAPERMRVPQADEMQRFFASIIHSLAKGPLPSLWYMPGNAKAMVINTGDGEGLGGTDLDRTINDAASYGGYFTSYLMQLGIESTDPAKEAQWRAAGHEVGPHVYGGGSDTCEAIGAAYYQIVAALINRFGHGARTARSHTIDWCGWVTMAAIEENNGTGMDLNYYHYLPSLQGQGANANGYFTGSGLPQKFSFGQAAPMGIYQLATQWPDEWFDNYGYTADAAFEVMREMLQASQQGFYSALVANIHHVRYDNVWGDITYSWANKLWSYAQSQGIPMWSAEKLLSFVEARNAARIRNLLWTGSTLTFDFDAPIPGQDLTLLIPTTLPGVRLTNVSIDGTNTSLHLESLKGRKFHLHTTRASAARVSAQYGPSTNLMSFTETTVSDFQSGSTENATITADDDGELRLSPAFYDAFDRTALGTSWSSGSWGGGPFLPGMDGQYLSLNNPGDGSFVRSVTALYPGTKVRARVQFSKGVSSSAPYLYFGLGGYGLVPWALVGTGYSGQGIYTSVYNSRPNDPATANLGIAFDEWHVFEIDWDTNEIRFSVDGALQKTEMITIQGPLYVFFSTADPTPVSASVKADWVRVEQYATNGIGRHTSPVFDAGWLTAWQELTWTGLQAPGTSITFETRSGSNPLPDAHWSDWQPVSDSIQSPASRCIQYRVTLGTTDRQASPFVSQVALTGVTSPLRPSLQATTAPGGLVLSWPAWTSGVRPVSAASPDSAARWLHVAGTPKLKNNRFELPVATTHQARFFQLASDYGPGSRPLPQ